MQSVGGVGRWWRSLGARYAEADEPDRMEMSSAEDEGPTGAPDGMSAAQARIPASPLPIQ